ncbi:MAG: OmpA family protein [Weeksellaceae bacterium]
MITIRNIILILLFTFFNCKEKTETIEEKAVEDTPSEVVEKDTTPQVKNEVEPAGSEMNYSGGNLSATGSGLTGTISSLNNIITMDADVLFDYDKANLKAEAEPSLQEVADVLRERKASVIAIIGHTDSHGSDDYNDKLSVKRADSVKQWFLENGLDIEIQTEGRGSKEPVAKNENPDGSDNPEGRAQNRRVVIKILKAEVIGG